MFGKTRQKIEEKYVKPVETGIATAIVLALLAFLMAAVALAMAVPGVTSDAV